MTDKPQANKPSIDKFIHCYLLNGLNGTQAAIDAGYSVKTAAAQGSRLLTTVKVKEAIAKAQKHEQTSFIWSKAKKLQTLQDIITKSMRPTVDPQGNERMESSASAVAAIKEHNIMQGDNAATAIEVTAPTAIEFRVVGAS